MVTINQALGFCSGSYGHRPGNRLPTFLAIKQFHQRQCKFNDRPGTSTGNTVTVHHNFGFNFIGIGKLVRKGRMTGGLFAPEKTVVLQNDGR